MGELDEVRYLIRDHDAKFTDSFRRDVPIEGARVLLTPAPMAKPSAERFVRTARSELLDRTIVVGEGTWCNS